MRKKVDILIELKSTVGEQYLHPVDEELHQWIISLFEEIEIKKSNIPVNNTDMTLLDKYFINMVYAETHD